MNTHNIVIKNNPKANPPVSGYQYRINEGYPINLGAAPGTYPIQLEDLDEVQVRALNSFGPGNWSPPRSYMTFSQALQLLAPYSPRLATNFLDAPNLFTEHTRTTPVTEIGDQIGGFTNWVTGQPHGEQATSGKRPIFGRRPLGGRRNLARRTEEFGSPWFTSNSAALGNAVADASPIGTPARPLTLQTETTSRLQATNWFSLQGNTSYVFSFYFKKISGGNLFRGIVTTFGSLECRFEFNFATETIDPHNGSGASLANTSQHVQAIGNGWFRGEIRFTTVASPTGNVGTQFIRFGEDITLYVWGVQLEIAEEATPYQRVGSGSWDVTEPGVPDVYGAFFDGNDNCLVVPNLDMSDTDKVTVIAGVRKLSDAATGFLVELTASLASNNGAFLLAAPAVNGGTSYRMLSKGTIIAETSGGVFAAAPNTSHLVSASSISDPFVQLRRNNHIVSTSTSSQGTGNYSQSNLNIGSRNNGASLPFNGWIHYLIVCGDIVPDTVLQKIYRGLGWRIGAAG